MEMHTESGMSSLHCSREKMFSYDWLMCVRGERRTIPPRLNLMGDMLPVQLWSDLMHHTQAHHFSTHQNRPRSNTPSRGPRSFRANQACLKHAVCTQSVHTAISDLHNWI